jgi:membrane-bound serine protease (ClpP class)
MLLGLFLALVKVTFPTQPWDVRRLENALVMMTVVMLVIVLAGAIIGKYLPATPYLRRLVLTSTGAATAEVAAAAPKAAVAIGDVGVAASKLRPAGKAQFGDQLVDVLTEGDFIEPGAKVEVVKLSGTHFVVRQLDTEPDEEPETR